MEAVGTNAERFLASIEEKMVRQRANTELMKQRYDQGDVPDSKLPCYDRCDGLIRLEIEPGRMVQGQCPAYLKPGTCPIITREARELAARMTHAGFGSRYHNPTADQMRARGSVEQFLGAIDHNLHEGRGLVLTGDVGTGKTMTMAYIARSLLRDSIGVWKVHMPTWTEDLADRQQRKALVERALRVQVLMLDDFGSGEMPTWVLGVLEGIVEARHGSQRSVIVSTNMSRDKLVKDVAFRRMVDRWRETCTIVSIGGASQRHD